MSTKYILLRYFTYLFIVIEVLLVPFYLDNDSYGRLEFYKNLSTLGSYSLLGSFSGYLYDKYKNKSECYNELLLWGIISSLLGGIFISIWYNSLFLIFLFSCNAIIIIHEKKLQTSGFFFLSILFKPLFSLVLVLIVGLIYFYFKLNIDLLLILSVSYLISYILWFYCCFKISKINLLEMKNRGLLKSFKIYISLVQKGFIINFSTILLSLILFNNRLFIKNYFPTELSSFSLAFNFSQFVFLGVNTISLFTTIKIGEKVDFLVRSYLNKILLKSFLLYLLLFLIGFIFTYIYNIYIKNFTNLIIYYTVLCLFTGLYHVFSVLSPVLLYKDTIMKSTIILALLVVLDYISTKIMLNLSLEALIILFKSGCLLLLAAAFNLYLIYFKSSIPE